MSGHRTSISALHSNIVYFNTTRYPAQHIGSSVHLSPPFGVSSLTSRPHFSPIRRIAIHRQHKIPLHIFHKQCFAFQISRCSTIRHQSCFIDYFASLNAITRNGMAQPHLTFPDTIPALRPYSLHKLGIDMCALPFHKPSDQIAFIATQVVSLKSKNMFISSASSLCHFFRNKSPPLLSRAASVLPGLHTA